MGHAALGHPLCQLVGRPRCGQVERLLARSLAASPRSAAFPQERHAAASDRKTCAKRIVPLRAILATSPGKQIMLQQVQLVGPSIIRLHHHQPTVTYDYYCSIAPVYDDPISDVRLFAPPPPWLADDDVVLLSYTDPSSRPSLFFLSIYY
jgi:hypothetical protein